MNTVKAIIVDDEPGGLYIIGKLLKDYCPEVKVVAACSSADSAFEQITLHEPQLVFLDISLPGKNSFELLEELPQIDFEIIFVTAHSDYMLKAFRYSAVDYLVKPVDEDLLMDAVHRAVKRIAANSIKYNITTLLQNITRSSQGQKAKLCIPSVKGFHVVDLHEIIYCEASGSYTHFHFLQMPVICASRPIHEYEELLSEAGFMRVHKSYLVNLSHVKEYVKGEGGTAILSNGYEIEVSRRKKDLFISRIKNFHLT
ncbi:MAG: LytTR family DNA-binding domain-containing protein [Chitinophagaceae bacterium]|nr:LytTR family DNA-binding domain-containing protein [Chitinophagaceae bacterium]MCU0403963.1 LytTR family DNA-binding domain-containing protein [Chitinophagaceae bacterium]